MNFHDIRIPEFIEVFAVGKPEFATSYAVTKSGREVRHLDRTYARHKYIIRNCRLSGLEFDQFNSFFRARRGSNFASRFRDFADYQVLQGFIAKGDGESKQFYLCKLYDDLVSPYSRMITKPVRNSVNLYIDKIETTFSIDDTQGVVTLPAILEENQILTADFVFDLAVRFKDDSFEYNYCSDGSLQYRIWSYLRSWYEYCDYY